MNENNKTVALSASGGATLTCLLLALGFRPAMHSGEYQLYLNVLHLNNRPCFAVNQKLDVWYDHGLKKGGDLMDFGRAYWNGLETGELSNKIIELCSGQMDTNIQQQKKSKRKRKAQKLPFYQIQETMPLGNNMEISNFLRSQCLWEMALGQMREVYYYVLDEKRLRKDFFAAGWPNENGGYEVRGRNFSGCLGAKGMTFLYNGNQELLIFGEYTDYLEWKYANRQSSTSVLVLNHPEFLSAALKRSEKFKMVTVLVTST